ncbi:hypothetical protein NC653_030340 [Populus alba x Populus x berolinensis]|uniref:Uncharacterized protein n=1 Tax=Populus alba x Populus x berolinensis TaxID=444605 RepID=A0AAD6LVQ9_9ROSI|nr:hypothetical protein NC653_030340 [Populus alba x Populus x berolinensis]
MKKRNQSPLQGKKKAYYKSKNSLILSHFLHQLPADDVIFLTCTSSPAVPSSLSSSLLFFSIKLWFKGFLLVLKKDSNFIILVSNLQKAREPYHIVVRGGHLN